jgi:flagellar motor switch protein FliG
MKRIRALARLTVLALLAGALGPSASARVSTLSAVDQVQRAAESQIRHLVEPLLDKYCHEECKLMSVQATVDIATPDEIAPGFDDVDPKAATTLAPSSAKVKMLIDEKVGPVSRGKLLELVQQYLDTLDYPVKVETQLSRFPQPVGSAGKVAELRDRVTKQFRNTVEDLFRQFCPEQCLLADYELQTEVTNAEEAQYGAAGEFFEDNGVAVRVKSISGTILVDDTLAPEERVNILEMAKLKTNYLRNVSLSAKSMKFPRPGSFEGASGLAVGRFGNNRGIASSQSNKSSESTSSKSDSRFSTSSTSQSTDSNQRQERFERIEKIERVEQGDAIHAELQKFKVYGLIFACSILSLLIFLAMASYRPKSSGAGGPSTIQRVIQSLASDPVTSAANAKAAAAGEPLSSSDRASLVAKRYEIERLIEELTAVYAQNPKVAKHVFTRILTEEGVETTAHYVHIFGESVVMDMLRDPSLQSDLSELMEFYAKNPVDMTDDEKLELLRKLHNRTIASKLLVMGSRSSNLFDFLAEMDGLQILELVRNESLTVKSIVLTQCDPQKRATIYAQLDQDMRMKLLAELSRIDYLPRDYIFNVANALKRKRRENPKLNTEALPGSEVLLTLLERSSHEMARTVIKNLEIQSPENARMLKSKLVSIDTLRYLRDGQLLEVVLSLRHDELLQFLKGAPKDIREAIFLKSPKDLVAEIEEELTNVSVLSREAYQAVERKVLNRMKLMANEGLINLVETNDRLLADGRNGGFVEAGPAPGTQAGGTQAGQPPAANIKKVAGW